MPCFTESDQKGGARTATKHLIYYSKGAKSHLLRNFEADGQNGFGKVQYFFPIHRKNAISDS